MPEPAGATTPVRSDPDVLIIGSGIAGLFSAYFLRLNGASVTVVERGKVGGPESCSWRNTGFVGTQGAAPLAEPGVLGQGLRWLLDPESPLYIRPRLELGLASWLWHFRGACNERDARTGYQILLEMKRRSLEILRELCAVGPLAAAFTAPGMVVAFKTPQGFERACRSVSAAVANGVPLRVLKAAELRELEPEVEFDISGALVNAEGAALRVPEFASGFGRVLTGMGVEIRELAEVTGFERAGREITTVRTTSGDFRPAEVIIAAGAWSARCARELGVGLQLQPAKGYTITSLAPAGAPRLPFLLSEGKVAIMPLGDRLRVGGTLELSGMRPGISQRRVAGILGTVRSFLPALEISGDLELWSGFRPCTPDSLPYIGRARSYRNLSIASGHGYIGMGLAPVGGKLIAQILAAKEPDMDVTPFRVDRW